jgi:hypothetical protein
MQAFRGCHRILGVPGCSHLIVGQDGWEQVVESALTWALAQSRPVDPTEPVLKAV